MYWPQHEGLTKKGRYLLEDSKSKKKKKERKKERKKEKDRKKERKFERKKERWKDRNKERKKESPRTLDFFIYWSWRVFEYGTGLHYSLHGQESWNGTTNINK